VSTTGESRTIEAGNERFRYRLSYADRDTLQLRVHPDLEVTAVAPIGRSPEEVDAKVRSRAGWIRRQQREFSLYQPLPQPRRFVSGETHWYLGRQYRLKLGVGENEVCLQHPFLLVNTGTEAGAARVGTLVENWYRDRAREVFPERLAHCIRLVRPIIESEPRLKIRAMAKRWGSCSPSGTITLNVDLVKVSTPCLDYVIVHELCHLRERNHSAEYYDLLSRYMPDWRARRARLNQSLC
jgi:predicted metal-dependent hydrolase